MGKFRKIQTLSWPITVRLATGRFETTKVKGKPVEKEIFDEERIKIKYKRLGKEDLSNFFARYQVDEDAVSQEEKMEAYQGMIDELCDTLILGWEIDDENGDPLEFNRENLAMVMNHPDYHTAIFNGFIAMQAGGAAKNS